MSDLTPPPKELVDRAFNEGKHLGPPWCGTVYCPICLEKTFSNLDQDDDAAPKFQVGDVVHVDGSSALLCDVTAVENHDGYQLVTLKWRPAVTVEDSEDLVLVERDGKKVDRT